jgi:hypothetical protein
MPPLITLPPCTSGRFPVERKFSEKSAVRFLSVQWAIFLAGFVVRPLAVRLVQMFEGLVDDDFMVGLHFAVLCLDFF